MISKLLRISKQLPDLSETADRGRRQSEQLGRRAEVLAALWLRLKGYRVLNRRFRAPTGEIDLIAKRGALIIAVEVKARRTLDQVLNGVTPRQRARIGETMDIWLHGPGRRTTTETFDVRFDVIGLIGSWRLKHIPDAWRP